MCMVNFAQYDITILVCMQYTHVLKSVGTGSISLFLYWNYVVITIFIIDSLGLFAVKFIRLRGTCGRRGTYFLDWWIWGASTAKKQMQTEDDSYFCVEIDSKLSNTLCHWIQISSLIIIAVPIQDTLPTTDSDWFCALNLYLIDSSLQNDTIYVILILMLCTVVSPICGNYTKFTKRSTGTLTSICVLEKLFQVLKSLSNPFSSCRKWWRIILT